ncbi:MAG TPA: secretin N-terminal domain-containing protein, partial [Urbifossiella sp.]|nr:secretin N-terminal domain-containing protein [Urbifossiella sp.]
MSPRLEVLKKSWKVRRWLPAALAALLGVGGAAAWAVAQPPAPKTETKKAPEPRKPADPKADPLAAERTISFTLGTASWKDVLEWYGKEAKLVLNTTAIPTGNCTLTPDKNRKYTIGEITDLLNESLLQQKFIIIRLEQTFSIWPLDEKELLDATVVPKIPLSELPKRGKTELVTCTLGPFKLLSPAEVRGDIEGMLSPFGKISIFERSNTIHITDKAGNIRRVKEFIDEYEQSDNGNVYTHKCEYVSAREMAEKLKGLLKDNDTTVEAPMTSVQFPNQFQPGFNGFNGFGGGRDPRGRDPRGRDTNNNNNNQNGPTAARSKTVQISVDDDRNSLTITAPETKLVQARKIVEDLDKPKNAGDQKIIPTAPVLKTYPVPQGTAEATAKSITEHYPWIRVTALTVLNQIMVVGSPEDHGKVSNLLGGGSPTGVAPGGDQVSKTIPLSTSDPKELAAILTKVFPSSTNGGPIIEPKDNGLFFSGAKEDYDKAMKIIQGYEGTTDFDPKNPRLQFSIEGGNAEVLAEDLATKLEAALRGMRKNPVIIQNLNGTGSLVRPSPISPLPQPLSPTAPKRAVPPMPPPLPLPRERKSELPPGPLDHHYVLAQLVDPDAKTPKPVYIRVVGNKLLIESQDPEALKLASELLKLYTPSQLTKPNENLFEVIKLKYVNAEDAAKVISEIFNGPPPQQQQQGGRGGFNPINLLGGLLGGGASTGTPTPGRVRVVAEKSSNSIVVVKSSRLDLLTMKKLLGSYIDTGDTDSEALQKTHIIQLKNTEAAEMATELEKLYKHLMAAPAQRGGGNRLPFPFGAGGGNTNPQEQKPPALSISVNDRTNSLLLMCTSTLFEEVRRTVDILDSAGASDSTEVVQIVPLRGIDPVIIQQMVEAMQGRDPNAIQNGRGGFGQNGRGGQGGFGQGGLGQGGFGQGGFGQGGRGGGFGGGGP